MSENVSGQTSLDPQTEGKGRKWEISMREKERIDVEVKRGIQNRDADVGSATARDLGYNPD